jgi:hypothetical protein
MLLTYPLVAQSTNSENINSALREYSVYNNTVPFQVIHKLQTLFIDQGCMLTFLMASSSSQEWGGKGDTHIFSFFDTKPRKSYNKYILT